MKAPSGAVNPNALTGWLVQVRRLTLGAQAVLLLVAFATKERPWAGLGLLGLFAGAELVRSALLPGRGSARLHALIDGLGLFLLIAAWGEPHQPLTVFYLVIAALFAAFSTRTEAWTAAGLAIVGQTAALLAPPLLGLAVHAEPPVHLLAHSATFALGVLAVAHFLGAVAEASRQQEQALRRADEDRERTARLAAIGTLAAGVAHELATPLGSVALLAEEIALDPGALPVLKAELARCRSILDRMLARGSAGEGCTVGLPEQVASWVEEWQRASPGVEVALRCPEPARCQGALAGGPDGWRAALWTVLDNAKTAGPPVRVAVLPWERGVRVEVEDHGPGIEPELAARVGEPFLTRWPSGKGAGLGLYVARTFARAARGDLRLEPRPEGGARAILSLVRDTPGEAP